MVSSHVCEKMTVNWADPQERPKVVKVKVGS